jgi:hypothetical protein
MIRLTLSRRYRAWRSWWQTRPVVGNPTGRAYLYSNEGFKMLRKKLAARVGAIVATAAIGVAVTAGAASAYDDTRYIGYGYTEAGTGVWCVQHMLNHNILFNAGLKEDGYWGPNTYAAVETFQSLVRNSSYSNMQVDGIVGDFTGMYLELYNNDGHVDYCQPYMPDETTHA